MLECAFCWWVHGKTPGSPSSWTRKKLYALTWPVSGELADRQQGHPLKQRPAASAAPESALEQAAFPIPTAVVCRAKTSGRVNNSSMSMAVLDFYSASWPQPDQDVPPPQKKHWPLISLPEMVVSCRSVVAPQGLNSRPGDSQMGELFLLPWWRILP